jgi:carbamoyl-phosphate synthase large subunit
MNVLILSAAAKVLLVRAFAVACHARGGRVFAADLGPDNAALFEADGAVFLPPSDAPQYPQVLSETCSRLGIRLVVPTRDGELAVLDRARERILAAGAAVLTPGSEALDICQDKRRFVAFCAQQGLATPRTYAVSQQPEQFPVFVRPVRGAGGKGARIIGRASDLPSDPDLLVQDVETAPEFTIDVLCDLQGQPLQAVARRRLVVRAGEAVKARIQAAPELEAQALTLCGALGLIGHNVVQAFDTPEAGARFIEVNPRFGGASNLSIQAGLASPERILQMLEGRGDSAAAPRDIIQDLTMLRYSEDRLVRGSELAALEAGAL